MDWLGLWDLVPQKRREVLGEEITKACRKAGKPLTTTKLVNMMLPVDLQGTKVSRRVHEELKHKAFFSWWRQGRRCVVMGNPNAHLRLWWPPGEEMPDGGSVHDRPSTANLWQFLSALQNFGIITIDKGNEKSDWSGLWADFLKPNVARLT